MPDQGQQRAQQPAPAKPVKLRESCDSCLVAKVKCSKQRPLCARCLITGYPCYYGPSSRSGKRRRNGNLEPTSNLPQQTTDASQQTAHLSKETNATVAAGTQAQVPACSMVTEHQSRFAMEESKSQMHTQNGMHNNTMHPANMTLPHVPDGDSLTADGHQLPTPNSPDPCGPWESFVPLSLPEDFLNFIETSPPMSSGGLDSSESAVNGSHNPRNSAGGSPFEQTTNHHPLHPSPLDMVSLGGSSSTGYHSNNYNCQPSRPLFLPQLHPPLAPPPTPTSPTQLLHQNSPPKDAVGQRPNSLPTECDCFAACLATLQILHNHSWLLSAADDTHAGPPFDSILTINKDAIDRCSRMLGCTKCVSRSGKSIAIMLIGSVFGKVMSLYRAACVMRFGSGNDTCNGSNGSADGKDSGVKNAGGGGGGRLKIQPSAQLAFGAYTVTGEDGRYLEIEILLLDLKRMEVALGAYQERFCSTPVMTNGAGGGGGAAGANGAAIPCSGNNEDEAGLYRALTQYFYKNLHYIVQYLKACKSGTAR